MFVQFGKEMTTITCTGESGSDTEKNIERILDPFTHNITFLRISNESRLETIPGIICRMELMEELDLSSNSINKLPRGCFPKLERLRRLDLQRNKITELRKGTFEGLQLLHELTLKYNEITSIELGVFSNQSDLVSLQNLDLGYNRLTSLDSWPLVRAWANPGCAVRLSDNEISIFTNNFNLTFRCGMQTPYAKLYLSENPIKHISDILGFVDIRNMRDLMCMVISDDRISFEIVLDSVPLICDCHDYAIFRILRYLRHVYYASGAFCSDPENLYGLKIENVPVDQLVCDIVDQCPYGCQCTKQPATLTIHINCTNSNLTRMPLNLPAIKQDSSYKYNLIMARNRIKRLDYRDYMRMTKNFDVNHSEVADVDVDLWRAFQYVNNINLNGNKLEIIPDMVQSLDYSNVVLDIRNNPFNCNCKNKWLKPWINSLADKLQNSKAIICYEPYWLNGKSIITLDDEEFCRGPPYTIEDILKITIPSISGVILLNVISVFLFKRFRIQIYKYVKLHPFDRDECIGEDVDYDVFLACASEDGALGYSILKLLEKSGCKVCYHKKDFIPGEHIIENIMQAVKRSKRTVCVLTGNFIKSGWCMEEFRQSHDRDLQQKKRRLVVLMVDPSGIEMEEMSTELRDYLSRYTYIEYQNKSWVDQLMYVMPVNRIKTYEDIIHEEEDEDSIVIRG